MSRALEAVPGFIEVNEAHRETTIVVAPASSSAAALHLRDELGFDFLSDITAVDYLGWGGKGVSGYIGTRGGRDLNTPMTQGLQALPGRSRSASRSTTTCCRSSPTAGGSACRPGSTTASPCRA